MSCGILCHRGSFSNDTCYEKGSENDCHLNVLLVHRTADY